LEDDAMTAFIFTAIVLLLIVLLCWFAMMRTEYCPAMTDMTERKFYNDLDNDAAADWTPVASDLSDVDRAWTMATHLCKMHRYHLQSYLGWGKAYGRGLVTDGN
jgi:hypothetical protein